MYSIHFCVISRSRDTKSPLSQPHQQDGTGHDVIEVFFLIPQASIQFQTDGLSLIVAVQHCWSIQEMVGRRTTAHLRLQRAETGGNLLQVSTPVYSPRTLTVTFILTFYTL